MVILTIIAVILLGAILTTTIFKVVAGTAFQFMNGDSHLRTSMLFAIAGLASLIAVFYFSA
jgi:hypothetical protein